MKKFGQQRSPQNPHCVSSGAPNLKRTGWSSFRTVAVGTILQTGDLLDATADYAANYDLYSQAIAALETEVKSRTVVIEDSRVFTA